MTPRLSSFKVRTTILALLALPLLALVGVGSWTAWGSWQTAFEMRRLHALAELAPLISASVHEFQKERGNSAGFIGNNGQGSFADRLASQRLQTDHVLERFDQSLTAFDLAFYGQSFAARLRAARATIKRLGAERGEVDSLGRSVADMAGYYTGVVDELLGVIEHMASLTSHAEAKTAIHAYLALLQTKEKAGIERAMGANGFGSGQFSPQVHRRFVELIGQQDAYLPIFASQATADQLEFYQKTVSGPVVNEVARLRQIAIESPFSGDLRDVRGSTWFDAITKKIGLLKTVEDRLSEDLLTLTAGVEADAQSAFLTVIGVISTLVTAVTALGLMVARHITQPLSAIAQVLQELKPGARVTIPCLDRRDEIGELARAFEDLAQKSLQAVRLKTALDCCQANVMVANRAHEIVHINPSLQRLLKSAETDIKRNLPSFDADQLIGINIDAFLSNPVHQRALLEDLLTTHQANIKIGGREMTLTVSAIMGDDGQRLGTVVEWEDQTAELAVQREIDNVVAAANRGDLGQRLTLDDKQGFMRTLGVGINQLTNLVENVTDDMGRFLEALARGDLSQEITTEYQGKFGALKTNANRTAGQLVQIVSDIHSAAGEVANAAAEISAGTEDLSRRTEEAASNLEETAASTEQMAATVKQNAQNAASADQLASSANEAATRGGQITDQAVVAMRDIEESASKIDAIIGVINEIAFQTNLLALNASVEAARAGEAGKGFAVVAQEVRALAQRSSQAADDIKTLITNSNEQVTEGVQLVDQAGEALREIVSSIGRVAGIVGDITTASNEQAAGVEEINSSVTQMDEMTQQNSALVEQSSAAARSLAEQADKLRELMGFFTLSVNQETLPVAPTTSEAPRSKELRPVLAAAGDNWDEF